MRRLLGTSLVALALTGALTACGSDDDTADDPAAPATSVSSAPVSNPPTTVPGHDWHVQIISATAAGGRAAPTASRIDTPAALSAFASQFSSPAVKSQLTKIVGDLDADTVLAAVIGMGCDVPPDATVEEDGDTVTVVAAKVADPLPECLAPVTSIAVVSR